MKITTIAGHELGPDLVEAWVELQRANADLESAFFHPEFTRCVAGVRPNVEVAIIEESGKIVGFFPFERVSRSLGKPIGAILSDYHGVVGAHDIDFDPLDLLRACNLIAWDFAHLPASQLRFREWMHRLIPSPQIDLADGYVAYAARKRASGSDLIDRVAYLERRLGREIGPIRYVANEIDQLVLDQVLAWKSAQYVRTGLSDFLHPLWTRALLRTIHETQTEGFAGVLSALYAGDRLIAGHFGMRSATSWHSWFPSYDPTFSKHSPGLILLLKMAESAPRLNVRMIDLGGELHPYKARFATGSTMLAGGSVALPTWVSLPHRIKRNVSTWVQNSPLETPALAIMRKWRCFTLPRS